MTPAQQILWALAFMLALANDNMGLTLIVLALAWVFNEGEN